MLVVQEKREVEANEFRPEPEHQEVEDACEVPFDRKNYPLWWSNAREDHQGGVQRRYRDDERGIGVTTAGAGDDEDELDNDDL